MLDLSVSAQSPDRRAIRPSLILSTVAGISALADAEALADEASSLLDHPELVGREPWRQTYAERVVGNGRRLLLLSRWPIEDNPPVVTVIDNGVVDATSYSVTGNNRHALYRQVGWSFAGSSSSPLTGMVDYPNQRLYYSVAYTAGYLMPGQVATWTAGGSYAAGGSASYSEDPGWARATDRTNPLLYEASGSGATGGSEPAWPATVGDTVVDGSITWTARAAFEWPSWAERSCLALAEWLSERPTRQAQEITAWGYSEEKFSDAEGVFPSAITERFRGLR